MYILYARVTNHYLSLRPSSHPIIPAVNAAHVLSCLARLPHPFSFCLLISSTPVFVYRRLPAKVRPPYLRYDPLKTPRNVKRKSKKQFVPRTHSSAVSGSDECASGVEEIMWERNLVTGIKVASRSKRLVLGRVSCCAWRIGQII